MLLFQWLCSMPDGGTNKASGIEKAGMLKCYFSLKKVRESTTQRDLAKEHSWEIEQQAKAPRICEGQWEEQCVGSRMGEEDSRPVQRVQREQQILQGLGTTGRILSFTLSCEAWDGFGLRNGVIHVSFQGWEPGCTREAAVLPQETFPTHLTLVIDLIFYQL